MVALAFDAKTGALRLPASEARLGELETLRLRLDCLPPEMLAARRWLLWKDGKRPFYPSGIPRNGRLDAQDDLDRLGTLDDALAALERDAAYQGLGFALGYDPELGKHWQGLDLDHALSGAAFTTERARVLYDLTAGYAERSPSGAGLHVLGLGEAFRSVKWHRPGEQAVELYSGGRFFTVTGAMLRDGGLPDLAPLAARVRADLLAAGHVRERKARSAAAGDYLERMPPNLREWVQAHPIEAALAEHGYTSEGDRWLSPRSESGIPGVVVLDEGRAVSFHASDAGIGTETAGDGEVFNALDLAVRYRFADDRRAAMRELLTPPRVEQAPVLTVPPEDNADPGEAPPKPPRFPVLTADDLARLPPVRWRVRGILPEQGLAAVYGPSGSGKSFLVLDMLGAVADSRAWFGYRVKPCAVTYVALEGEAGIAQRLAAYRTRHGRAPASMRFIAAPFALLDDRDVRELADAIRKSGGAGGVVVIDTLNRAAVGADENSSVDMSRLIEGAKALQRELGGVVVLVHHSGKDLARGLRGHSSLHGALDAVIEVSRDGDRREWRNAKAKDDRDGDSHPFRLEVVELGGDADGEPISSCVVTPEERPADAVRRVKLPQGGNQRIVWDALGAAFREARDFGQAGAPASRPCLRLEDAVAKCHGRLPVDSDRQAERIRQAIAGLVARGLLELREGWLWCA
jgi:KaiC/GvpD/RAD55 family RecA-like ATPase